MHLAQKAQVLIGAGCLMVVGSLAAPAQALVFDWRSEAGVTTNPTSLEQTVGGVTVTAMGHLVEFGSSGSTIFGPYPTAQNVRGNESFGIGPRGSAEPLGMLIDAGFAGIPSTSDDTGSAVIAPGIDNFSFDNENVAGDPLPSLEFVLFEFSQPIDINSITVDDTSNFGRSIWAASGPSGPDLAQNFLDAFAGLEVVNLSDDASDGEFMHFLPNGDEISFLAVGAPIPVAVGDLGRFADGSAQFFISELNFTPGQGNGGNGDGNGGPGGPGGGVDVAEPGATGLLALGLLSAYGAARRRR